jgi:hypothetical protein
MNQILTLTLPLLDAALEINGIRQSIHSMHIRADVTIPSVHLEVTPQTGVRASAGQTLQVKIHKDVPPLVVRFGPGQDTNAQNGLPFELELVDSSQTHSLIVCLRTAVSRLDKSFPRK